MDNGKKRILDIYEPLMQKLIESCSVNDIPTEQSRRYMEPLLVAEQPDIKTRMQRLQDLNNEVARAILYFKYREKDFGRT